MNAGNLAIIFGPCIFYSNDNSDVKSVIKLTEWMIQESALLFQQ